MQESPAKAADDEPRSSLGLAALGVVALAAYAFLVVMASFEPITGDGFYVSSDTARMGLDLHELARWMQTNHDKHNPRLGQLFTYFVYLPGFHVVVTPLVICALFVLMFVHATGRWPRATVRDAALLACAMACAWLATPSPGHAYFYRPVTTNYIYSFALVLAYFLPFRRGVDIASKARLAIVSIAMLIFGMPIGMLNEHTGPTVIALAAGCALLAAHDKRWNDATWMASSTLGLIVGYQYLFFAPGLGKRAGHVDQSVVETVLLRGVSGNAALLTDFAQWIAPLIGLLALLFALAASRGVANALSTPAARTRLRVLAVYVVLAMMVLGTSLAAPRSHYRLAMAPALLLAIAALGVIELVSRDAWLKRVIATLALCTHLVFAWVFLDLYREIHADELVRLRLAQAAPPGSVLRLPRNRNTEKSPLFYGDTLPSENKHRVRMARVYHLEKVVMERSRERSKGKAKPKPR